MLNRDIFRRSPFDFVDSEVQGFNTTKLAPTSPVKLEPRKRLTGNTSNNTLLVSPVEKAKIDGKMGSVSLPSVPPPSSPVPTNSVANGLSEVPADAVSTSSENIPVTSA